VAPTIELLHQWYARLVNAFGTEIGVYYGAEKIALPITVTTYHSAGDVVARHGNAFKLIIFDEVHHLPAPNWGETALMSPSPCRLGLTATYPEEYEQGDGRWRVDELIGPIVYSKPIDDLVGSQLTAKRYCMRSLPVRPSKSKKHGGEGNNMLTGDLVRPRIRRQGDSLLVDYLDVSQRHWQQTARELIALLNTFMGKPYAAWEETLEKYEGERIDYVVIRGLAKVLEDAATFGPVETMFTPAEVREKLFACGPINPRIDLFNRGEPVMK